MPHFHAFVRVWHSVRLRTLPGFPAWEREAFDLFHQHFSRLGTLYLEYASAHEIGRPPVLTAASWDVLCADRGVLTEGFSRGAARAVYDAATRRIEATVQERHRSGADRRAAMLARRLSSRDLAQFVVMRSAGL